MKLQKGYIYYSYFLEEDPHPIVCMENEQEGKELYKACVLTHDSVSTDAPRVSMHRTHFKNKNFCRVKYDQVRGTCLIKVGFAKKLLRINPEPVGQLTEEGIRFVEENMNDCDYAYFPHPMSKYPEGYNPIS